MPPLLDFPPPPVDDNPSASGCRSCRQVALAATARNYTGWLSSGCHGRHCGIHRQRCLRRRPASQGRRQPTACALMLHIGMLFALLVATNDLHHALADHCQSILDKNTVLPGWAGEVSSAVGSQVGIFCASTCSTDVLAGAVAPAVGASGHATREAGSACARRSAMPECGT